MDITITRESNDNACIWDISGLPDEKLGYMKLALNYPDTVPNPDYDSEKDDPWLALIPNPVSLVEHWSKICLDNLNEKIKGIVRVQLNTNIDEQVEASQITMQ